MSEQESESPAGDPDAGREGLQEADLDSVRGGGAIEEPFMDVEAAELDTVQKSGEPDNLETKDGAGGSGDSSEPA